MTYVDIMLNREAMMGIISCVMGTIFLLYNEPLISDQLLHVGVSEHLIGLIFAGACLSYAVTAPLVGYIKTKNNEIVSLLTFMMIAFSIFL